MHVLEWFLIPATIFFYPVSFYSGRPQFDDGVRERVVDVCVEMQALVQGLQQRYLAEVRHVYISPPPPINHHAIFRQTKQILFGSSIDDFFIVVRDKCEICHLNTFFYVHCLAARRYCYVTPTSYLDLIKTFTSLYNSKRARVLGDKARYETGLRKLGETAVQVRDMQGELELLRPKLIQVCVTYDLHAHDNGQTW